MVVNGIGSRYTFNMESTTAGVKSFASAGIKYKCFGERMEIIPLQDASHPNGTESWTEQYVSSTTTIAEFLDVSSTAPHNDRTSTEFSSIIPPGEVPNLILYCIVFFLAVVGNSLAITTLLLNIRMKTVANCFLLSLSVSDLSLAVICMPVSITGRILKRFIFGRIGCKIILLLMGSSVGISTFTMLAISIERYYAICKPLQSRAWQTRSHAYKVIVGIWIVSCILNLPYAILGDIKDVPLIDYGKCTTACRPFFPSQQATRVWYLYLLLALLCVPGILMTTSYSRISSMIWKQFKFKSTNTTTDEHIDDENDTNDGLYIAHRRHSTKSFKQFRYSIRKLIARSSHGKEVSTATASPPLLDISSVGMSGTPKIETKFPYKAGASGAQTAPKSKRNPTGNDTRVFSAAERLKAKKKVVRMLIVIVILFFVCWTPLFIVNVWRAFDPETAQEKLDGVIEIIQLMSFVSTCVNPLVYCFMNKRFRAGFLKSFLMCVPSDKRCCCKNRRLRAA